MRDMRMRTRTRRGGYLPKPLRTLYRGGRARAVNGFTRRNGAINEIERQCHEKSDFGHKVPTLLAHTGGNPYVRIAPALR